MGKLVGVLILVAVAAFLWGVVAILPATTVALFVGALLGAGGVTAGVVVGVMSAPGRERQIVIVERSVAEDERLLLP